MVKFLRRFGIVVLALAVSWGVSPASANAAPDRSVMAADDQYFEIRSQLNQRCVDVLAAGNGDGVPVEVADCWGGANQKWRLFYVGNGYYELHPLNSQRCLDIT